MPTETLRRFGRAHWPSPASERSRQNDEAMTAEWGGYEPYMPPVAKPHREMSRQEAKLSFDDVMANRQFRIEALERLARRNGVPLGDSAEAMDAFGRWLYANVEPDLDRPARLKSVWYGVVFDAGLYLGDLIIRLNPLRSWELKGGGKTNVAFQKSVIAGFPNDPKYSVDPDRYVVGLAHRSVSGRLLEDSPIWEYVQIAASDD